MLDASRGRAGGPAIGERLPPPTHAPCRPAEKSPRGKLYQTTDIQIFMFISLRGRGDSYSVF